MILATLLAAGASLLQEVPIPAIGEPPAPVHVEVTLSLEPETSVEFQVSVPGSPTGETRFQVADFWGGVDAGGEDLEPIEALGRDGRTLEHERPAPHLWVVRHAPDEPVSIRYRIRANEHQRAESLNTSRRPIVTGELFHSHGHFAFWFPEHLDGWMPRPIRFYWRGFEEAGWSVATPFGIPEGGLVVATAPLWKAQGTVYVAGAGLRLHELDVAGSPVVVAMAGDAWRFEDAEFVELARRVIETERRFFGDLDQAFYLVVLIPNGPPVDPNTNRMGGTGLYRAIALTMSPNASLEGGAGLAVAKLLAHEHFHEWTGQVIGRVHPERLVYWFTEGFTAFYERRMLLRAGLMDAAQYAEAVNRSLARYVTSPVKTEPNQRILEDQWNVPEVGDLAYYRGDLVAMLVDRELREVSGGERSLDDVMRGLSRDGHQQGLRVDTELLLDRFEQAGAGELVPLLRRVIVDGEEAPIPEDLFAPCFVMSTEPGSAYELGWDLELSQVEHVLRGVVPGSAAYAAGLRDGQRVRSWTLHGNRTDLPVELEVEAEGGTLEVSYLPIATGDAGDALLVPRFSPLEGADCSRL